MKKITLSGGFHHRAPKGVTISDNAYADLKAGNAALYEVLSKSQQRRLDNYFCGIRGCECGSYINAKIDF